MQIFVGRISHVDGMRADAQRHVDGDCYGHPFRHPGHQCNKADILNLNAFGSGYRIYRLDQVLLLFQVLYTAILIQFGVEVRSVEFITRSQLQLNLKSTCSCAMRQHANSVRATVAP